jgi:hypothetical protein
MPTPEEARLLQQERAGIHMVSHTSTGRPSATAVRIRCMTGEPGGSS